MTLKSGTASLDSLGARFCTGSFSRCSRPLRDMEFAQQALYCYGKVYALDPDHVDAMWDRATLAKELGDLKTVRVALACDVRY
jgi:hypothetical protein